MFASIIDFGRHVAECVSLVFTSTDNEIAAIISENTEVDTIGRIAANAVGLVAQIIAAPAAMTTGLVVATSSKAGIAFQSKNAAIVAGSLTIIGAGIGAGALTLVSPVIGVTVLAGTIINAILFSRQSKKNPIAISGAVISSANGKPLDINAKKELEAADKFMAAMKAANAAQEQAVPA